LKNFCIFAGASYDLIAGECRLHSKHTKRAGAASVD
jgi:hypothetical protein